MCQQIKNGLFPVDLQIDNFCEFPKWPISANDFDGTYISHEYEYEYKRNENVFDYEYSKKYLNVGTFWIHTTILRLCGSAILYM